MRIISFAEKWPHKKNFLPPVKGERFSTFRFPRADSDRGRDWRQDEEVQIVIQSRSPNREYMGDALIVAKTPMIVSQISHLEAVADGFPGGYVQMFDWLMKAHRVQYDELEIKPINKLVIEWIAR